MALLTEIVQVGDVLWYLPATYHDRESFQVVDLPNASYPQSIKLTGINAETGVLSNDTFLHSFKDLDKSFKLAPTELMKSQAPIISLLFLTSLAGLSEKVSSLLVELEI